MKQNRKLIVIKSFTENGFTFTMRKFLVLVIFIPNLSFSQSRNIVVQLESDSTIYTNWIKLYDSPFLQRPYVSINDFSGPKIKIRDLKYYKGKDQNGDYRYLEKVQTGKSRGYKFTERVFSFDTTKTVQLCHDRLTFGGLDISSSRNYQYYSINNSIKKNLNYKNVNKEEFNNQMAENYLRKANGIRLAQFVSAGIGFALISSTFINNASYNGEEYLDSTTNVKLIAGSALMVFPFTLEKAKTRQLKKALRTID